jgi:hypothetical protein
MATTEPTLRAVADGIWVADKTDHAMMGIHLGTRMTVVRLSNGGLFLHSPIALTPGLRAAVDALGPVRHIVCPNLYHHVYAGQWAEAYPAALLHGPAALAKKRKDLRFHSALSSAAHPDWAGDLVPHPIEGCDLQETVFLHPATKTLISSDLTENFTRCDHLPTRIYLKAAGIWQKPGWSRLLRWMYRDKRAARRSIDALLALDWDRLIVAHGDVFPSGGKDAVRATFHFLD